MSRFEGMLPLEALVIHTGCAQISNPSEYELTWHLFTALETLYLPQRVLLKLKTGDARCLPSTTTD